MEEKINEQTEITSQPAEAEEETATGEEVSLGKFKDANALYKAYNSLQSEFTKRCQRLKELEAALEQANNPENTALRSERGITDEEKEEILKGYLKSVLGAKSKAIVMDGAGATLKTASNRPSTLADAGEFAKQYLSK